MLLQLDSMPAAGIRGFAESRLATSPLPAWSNRQRHELGLGLGEERIAVNVRTVPNVVFSCELAWRGPCASTGRDKVDRQLQNSVIQSPAISSIRDVSVSMYSGVGSRTKIQLPYTSGTLVDCCGHYVERIARKRRGIFAPNWHLRHIDSSVLPALVAVLGDRWVGLLGTSADGPSGDNANLLAP